MSKLILTTLAINILFVSGCVSKWLGKEQVWRQYPIADVDTTTQTGDVWAVYKWGLRKGQRYNASLKERRSKRVNAILNEMKNDIRKMDGEKLIQSFKGGGDYSGVEYHVIVCGNYLIVKELMTRKFRVKETLNKYKNSNKDVFTGANGPIESIGTICTMLLDYIELSNQAEAAFNLWSYHKALTLYLQLVHYSEAYSCSVGIGTYVRIADCYYQIGDYKMAKKYYEICLESYPKGSGRYYVSLKLGDCCVLLGQEQEARKSYERGFDCYGYPEIDIEERIKRIKMTRIGKE